ncbi:glycosyltransferase [Rathayibacter rathayi]|uniref:Glycosyltransferase n=1 Tax=Rathayibacter rathayi TaxID=33887 RepID=A0ABX5AAR6_RATRA|nr:glycosyltransferase [Rathayibacter rathayi]PPF23725.1 glycosyltransferase [Rathayibacter rathayi]PPG93109.1 glycosyltransferase [Rathayibacter rathayi]PPH21569.1 glycosyltransferase [Rathayibacter rathayi]PPH76198.1 glycosyltransferase [Rathayibacter rathayi]PPI69735.1 glycosyltransferase [Rathayibacter rathayi]
MHPALAAVGRRVRPCPRVAALGRRVRPRTRLRGVAQVLHSVSGRLATRRAAAVAARPIDHPSPAVRVELLALALANRFSRRSAVDPDGEVVVTMTTHGDRLQRVHVALESIARGQARPARLVLWLDDPALHTDLPAPLRRLRRRGVEIRLVDGYRVHTKYYPHLLSGRAGERDLVTSDDDIVYPRTWLRGLLDARSRYPRETVLCYRAHRVGVADGAVAPYTSWTPVADTHAATDVFGTSVSGQLLPRALLGEIAAHGDAFREIAPDADDIWLHVRAVDAGYRIAQIEPRAQLFPFVPRTQQSGLYLVNYWDGGNDRQVRAAYTPEVTALIAADAAARGAGA